MQRKSQQPVDTRGDLVAAAARLFETHGYDATSVQEIIDAAQVSKGTFYHHFQSKQEILDAVVARMTGDFLESIEPTVAEPSRSAVDKLRLFLDASQRWRSAHLPLVRETLRVLMRDENAIIRHKVDRQRRARAGPVLAAIVRQGMREGVFDAPDPENTADLLLQLGSLLSEKNALLLLDGEASAADVATIKRDVDFAIDAIERLLGARRGTLERIEEAVVAELARAFAEGVALTAR